MKLTGSVALVDDHLGAAGCRGEEASLDRAPPTCELVRRLPVPTRGHHARGALVPALRVVVPGVEELLAERGLRVDHVTIYRWVHRFTPLLIDAARPCRHAVGQQWHVDETYVRVAGIWRYVYRAVDESGQVVDIYVSTRRNAHAARTFFGRAIIAHGAPSSVVTDKARSLAGAIEDLIPEAEHDTSRYANNRVECDHGQLKARLRPMRGLKADRTAGRVIAGHTFVQNIRRGHYELGVHELNRGPSGWTRRP